MNRFRFGHAAHPDWRQAALLALAAMERTAPANGPAKGTEPLGIVYTTAELGPHLAGLISLLREHTGVAHWTGGVGQGVCGGSTEYDQGTAVALMLADLPAQGFRVFSGRRPLPGNGAWPTGAAWANAHTAIVHADPATRELPELLTELSERTGSGFLFGSVVGAGEPAGDCQVADGAFSGGLSGALFAPSVQLVSRVTQGCRALAGEHRVSGCSPHFIHALDGRPALDVLLDDLGVTQRARASRDGDEILRALPLERLRGGLLVGLSGLGAQGPVFGDFLVRNVVGIDPHNRLLAIAGAAREGDRAVFCTRDADAARRDLIRICTELRDELEDSAGQALGAIYHSCAGRGSSLFGAPGAEPEIIRHNLDGIPLIGVYANGEIAGDRIYGYTGVLTLFVRDAPQSAGRLP